MLGEEGLVKVQMVEVVNVFEFSDAFELADCSLLGEIPVLTIEGVFEGFLNFKAIYN